MAAFQKGQGRWVKGVSGNPSGKGGGYHELQALARKCSPEALSKIMEVLRQKKYPKLALKAAELILDRAWGKCPQAVTGEGGEGPIKISVSWQAADVATLDITPNEKPRLLKAEEVPDGDADKD